MRGSAESQFLWLMPSFAKSKFIARQRSPLENKGGQTFPAQNSELRSNVELIGSLKEHHAYCSCASQFSPAFEPELQNSDPVAAAFKKLIGFRKFYKIQYFTSDDFCEARKFLQRVDREQRRISFRALTQRSRSAHLKKH